MSMHRNNRAGQSIESINGCGEWTAVHPPERAFPRVDQPNQSVQGGGEKTADSEERDEDEGLDIGEGVRWAG